MELAEPLDFGDFGWRSASSVCVRTPSRTAPVDKKYAGTSPERAIQLSPAR